MSDTTNPYAPTSDTNAEVDAADVPRLEPPQTVRYSYTPELLTALWTHRTTHSPSDARVRSRSSWTLILLGGVPAVLVGALAWEGELAYWIAAPLVAVFVGLSAMGVQYRRRSIIQQSCAQAANRLLDESPNEHFLSERVVTLDERGVRQVMPGGEAFTRWTAFERLDHTDDYFFAYDSSITAVVVPRAAFVTRAQFLGFVEMAHRLWQAGRDQPKPSAEAV